ncbi:hypothetical protein BASA81_002494 [Batrachochytrium salamandrivorans]|nr:hypothetical protein BASA81_002494 [Batrachochytrium salamandrivorans]
MNDPPNPTPKVTAKRNRPQRAAPASRPLSVTAAPFVPDLYIKLPDTLPPSAVLPSKRQARPPRRQSNLESPLPNSSKNKRPTPVAPNPKRNPAPVKRWWHSLKDVDPITLFPLRQLKIEPFELSVSDSTVKHFFDCESLASYLLQTGKFLDPINRQPISRDECLRLDSHLRRFGLAKLAKCVEMMDLQNSSTITTNNGGGLSGEDRRRQHIVLASGLFQYPSLAGSVPTNSTSNRTSGGVRVLDDDEDRFVNPGDGGGQLVEDDFPEMPLVRRRATANDFPAISHVNTRPWACPDCSLENTAGSRECLACGRAINTSIPVAVAAPPLWQTASSAAAAVRTATSASSSFASLESWRRQKAMAAAAGEDDRDRPRLVLSAPKGSGGAAITRPESVFGKAKPIDISILTQTTTAAQQQDACHELCPYQARFVQSAAKFGFTWVTQMERTFKSLVDSGNTRNSVSLEPMPEAKRTFLRVLATKYYGLHCVECDPEPKRFLQLANTPTAFVPDLTMSQALMRFPASRLQLEAVASSCGILLVGTKLTPKQLSQGVLVNELNLRESEFDLFWLENLLGGGEGGEEEQRVCFVNIVSNERARKVYKKLQAGNISSISNRMYFWPCGMDWAKVQIRHMNLAKAPLLPSTLGSPTDLWEGDKDLPQRQDVAYFAQVELFIVGGRMLAAELREKITHKFGMPYQAMKFTERTLTQFLIQETHSEITRVDKDFVLMSEMDINQLSPPPPPPQQEEDLSSEEE